jgi:hypothetical protein
LASFWIRKRHRAEKRGGRGEKAKGFSTTDQTDITDGILFISRGGKLNALTRRFLTRLTGMVRIRRGRDVLAASRRVEKQRRGKRKAAKEKRI